MTSVPHSINGHEHGKSAYSTTCHEYWNYKHADYIRLNELKEQFNWNDVFDSNDAGDISNKFTSVLLGFCKCCIPCLQTNLNS